MESNEDNPITVAEWADKTNVANTETRTEGKSESMNVYRKKYKREKAETVKSDKKGGNISELAVTNTKAVTKADDINTVDDVIKDVTESIKKTSDSEPQSTDAAEETGGQSNDAEKSVTDPHENVKVKEKDQTTIKDSDKPETEPAMNDEKEMEKGEEHKTGTEDGHQTKK
jgi:hypothetical protein